MHVISLPEGTAFRLDEKGDPVVNGKSHVIVVNTHVAYPAILREYRDLYDERIPAEFLDEDGKPKKEWKACLGNLKAEKPTAYWMEVAHQSVKLDIQIACRTFALNLHFKDPGKKYRQADAPKGRDPLHAAGGGGLVARKDQPRGKEAREHYKRLRGFIPA